MTSLGIVETESSLRSLSVSLFPCLTLICLFIILGEKGTQRFTSLYLLGWFSGGREWLPMAVFLPGEFHGQRNLMGCSPCRRKELDTADTFTFQIYWRRWQLCLATVGSSVLCVWIQGWESVILNINIEVLSSSFLSSYSYLGHLERMNYISWIIYSWKYKYEEQDFIYFENEILTPLDVSWSLWCASAFESSFPFAPSHA